MAQDKHPQNRAISGLVADASPEEVRADSHPARAPGTVSWTPEGRSSDRLMRDADFETIAESIPHIAWLASPDGSTQYLSRLGAEYTGKVVNVLLQVGDADHR